MSGNAASFIGNIPENYDRGLGPVIFADFAEEIAQRAAGLVPSRVLETCAGTGIVTRRLRDLLPVATQLTATDLNPPMLEIARGKFAAAETVEFRPADAMALPFPDQAFDAVVSQFGVMFFPDKTKSYAEAYRVLQPGGHYLFSVWDAHRHNPFGQLAHELIAGFFPADPPQFYQVPFSYHRLDPIKDALAEAGFVDLRIAVRRRDQTIPDITAFAHGVIYGNPVRDQILARGGDPERIVSALIEVYHREFGSDPSRMPLQSIQFMARRPD